jgi:2-polyprenyl-3-methyl-5-hydroxy-6-metoxy-1,4-benzoquinol methylase
VGRLFNAGLGVLEMATVDIGVRLGLYQALADAGPSTPNELAEAAGIHARYSREWLEQQAVAGILEVDDVSADEDERRYSVPAAYIPVLLDPEDLAYTAPFAAVVPIIGKVYDTLLDAFRTGKGVPYADYELHDLQSGFTRPQFHHLLATEWIPALPDVQARLQTGDARVAEIGCGEGWASITLATNYPGVSVDGFDLDEASIAIARRNAADAGVEDRVRFEVKDAADEHLAGRYDLVFAVEMVHDLSRPVDVLRTMRRLRNDTGAVLVIDERVADVFTAPGDEMERTFYGFSVVHCLPAGMAEQPSAGTGTVMRTSTLARYADEAGYDRVDVLPVDHEMFRLYRLEG